MTKRDPHGVGHADLATAGAHEFAPFGCGHAVQVVYRAVAARAVLARAGGQLFAGNGTGRLDDGNPRHVTPRVVGHKLRRPAGPRNTARREARMRVAARTAWWRIMTAR